MQNEYKIIQYLSNYKIYKHNSSIYVCLRRLLNDPSSLIVQLDIALTPVLVALFFTMTCS
jgi:hypothetical protein